MNTLYWFWRGMIVHLWQTTLVLALIFVIEQSLRGAPSRIRHTLWSVGLAKIFLPLSVFGGMSSLLYRAAAGGRTGAGEAALPMLQPVVAVLYPLSDTGAPSIGSTLSYVVVAATAIWAAFTLYFVARIVIDAARARWHGGRPLGCFDSSVARRLERILASAGIPSESVLLSVRFVMPTVIGLIRPRIVIPEYLAGELQEEELRAILLHEETHRRRRDPLRAAVHRLGQALFFFYPLIYPVLRELQATAEYACDESVVHSGVPARAYSRALARTLELGLASPAFATAAAAGSSLLRRRLKRLSTLNPGGYAMRLQYRILIVIAALVVAAATFYPAPMRADRAGKPDSSKALEQMFGPRDFYPFDTAPVLLKSSQPVTPDKARKLGVEATLLRAITGKPDSSNATEYRTADGSYHVFYAFDTAPVLLKAQNPVYPEEARKLGVEATVLLDITLDETGKVTKAQVIDPDNPEIFGQPAVQKIDSAQLEELKSQFGSKTVEAAELRPLFEKSAIDAAMKFIFKPATYEGKAVPSDVAVPIRFKLH